MKQKFTLIELMIVLTIIAILTTLGIGQWQLMKDREALENCEAWKAGEYYESHEAEEKLLKRVCGD